MDNTTFWLIWAAASEDAKRSKSPDTIGEGMQLLAIYLIITAACFYIGTHREVKEPYFAETTLSAIIFAGIDYAEYNLFLIPLLNYTKFEFSSIIIILNIVLCSFLFLYHISLPSLHRWIKKGSLPQYNVFLAAGIRLVMPVSWWIIITSLTLKELSGSWNMQ